MTTIPRIPASASRPTHDRFIHVVHAEWTKFRTVRGWVVGAVVSVLLTLLFTYLVSNGTHQGICTGESPSSMVCSNSHPFVPTGPDGEAVADSFYFVNQTLTGDGTITARVTSLSGQVSSNPGNEAPSLSNTRPGLADWAKAGILITPSTAEGSAYAAVMVTGSRGVRFQYDYTHDRAGLPGQVAATSPRWLRLVRSGDTITGYDSADGQSWTKIDSVRLSGLPSTVNFGLFVTSPVVFEPSTTHQPTLATAVPVNRGQPSLATAQFDQVSLQSSQPAGDWQGTSIGTRPPSSTGPGDFYPILTSGNYQRSGTAFSVTGSGDIAPGVVAGEGANTMVSSLLFPLSVGLIAIVVVAALFITSEYRRGLIHTTLAAVPRRSRMLVAKAIVVGVVSFVTALVAVGIATPLSGHILRGNGNYVFPVNTFTEMRIVAGAAAVVACTALLALALGTILRSSGGAVSVGIVLLVLPYLFIAAVSGSGIEWMLKWTPAAALAVLGELPRSAEVSYPYTVGKGYFPLAPWEGLAVLCVYTLLSLGLATLLLQRRDA